MLGNTRPRGGALEQGNLEEQPEYSPAISVAICSERLPPHGSPFHEIDRYYIKTEIGSRSIHPDSLFTRNMRHSRPDECFNSSRQSWDDLGIWGKRLAAVPQVRVVSDPSDGYAWCPYDSEPKKNSLVIFIGKDYRARGLYI